MSKENKKPTSKEIEKRGYNSPPKNQPQKPSAPPKPPTPKKNN